jgi:hypothetical protein
MKIGHKFLCKTSQLPSLTHLDIPMMYLTSRLSESWCDFLRGIKTLKLSHEIASEEFGNYMIYKGDEWGATDYSLPTRLFGLNLDSVNFDLP